jgi:hypothetical protein
VRLVIDSRRLAFVPYLTLYSWSLFDEIVPPSLLVYGQLIKLVGLDPSNDADVWPGAEKVP